MMKRIAWGLSVLLGSACSQTGNVPADMSAMADMSVASPDLRAARDTTAPSFAGLVSAVSAGSTAITLSWAAAIDEVTPSEQITYLVYQAAITNGQMLLSPTYTTSPGVTMFSVTELQPNTRYYFVVRARDLVGNTDSNRLERVVTTDQIPDTQVPLFGGVAAATPTGNTIKLTWAAATDDLTQATQLSYLIYQSKVSGGQDLTQPTDISAPGVTEHAITGLDARTTYYFVVRARDLSVNIETNVIEKSALTGDISFSGNVQPALTGCVTCHSGAMPAQGLNLADAATSYLSLVNRPSTECTANLLVKPGQPDQSYLIWKLQGMGPCFVGGQMRLVASGQNTVRGWIQAGAPNN